MSGLKTPANEYKLSAGNLFAIEGQFSKTVMFNNICFQLSFLNSQGFLQENMYKGDFRQTK